jgi:hypothetical protein
MKNFITLLVLSLILVSCGGGSTGSPSVTVTGPSSNLLKIGEVTNFTATFKDASGASIVKKFTWTSSAPNIAEVDQSGKVTVKRLGKVTISAGADGTNGSSAIQQTYGLEVIGGTYDFSAYSGQPASLQTLIRFRTSTAAPIAANTAFTVSISGPTAWNGGVAVNSGPWSMGTGGVSIPPQSLAFPKAVVSGTYQASTTINGVTYSSSFVVDAAQVQAKVSSITQTGSATSSDVAASWTAGAGATSYQMLVGDSAGFKKSVYTTETNAALNGMSLVTANQNFIFVGAMNFKFDAGLDVVAPAQFNVGFNFKQIIF